MSIKEEYDLAYAKYTKLLEEHNNELIQVISVSDEVSKEIFRESYLEVQNKLQMAEAYYKSLESQFLAEIVDELFLEYLSFYASQFVECSVEQAFLTNNLDLQELTKKYRMRPITSLEQKRELCILMNEMHIQLKLIDYEGKPVDVIGKPANSGTTNGSTTNSGTTKQIVIRCKGIASVSESIELIPIIQVAGV